MSEIEEIRIEVLAELLDSNGIIATGEQVQSIAADFANHIDMEREMAMNQHLGGRRECDCKRLKSDLERAESDIAIYQKSVIDRRGAVRAYVQDGRVKYDMN